MQSKTDKTRPVPAARPAASLRSLDLELMQRFGTEIAPGLHVLTGATARREAERLRKQLSALERLARQAVPVRIEDDLGERDDT